MAIRDYMEEAFGGLPSFITGAGPISNHGKYIDEMIEKLKGIKVIPETPWPRQAKKRVKLAQKTISELEKLRKTLNTVHYGKGM